MANGTNGMRHMIGICIVFVIIAVAMSAQAFRLHDEKQLLEVQVHKLTERVEFLEPQVTQWRDAYETIQEVRGAKRD